MKPPLIISGKQTHRTTLSPRSLLEAGYHQVSRKFRLIARLPPGKTGRELLAEAWAEGRTGAHADNERRRAWRFSEADATDQWLRVHCLEWIELTPTQFAEFRRIGGRTVR